MATMSANKHYSDVYHTAFTNMVITNKDQFCLHFFQVCQAELQQQQNERRKNHD